MAKDPDDERAIDLARQRWAEIDEALSERTAALTEVQRHIRAALVEYFSILQEWVHEDAIAERPAASHLDQPVFDAITEPSNVVDDELDSAPVSDDASVDGQS